MQYKSCQTIDGMRFIDGRCNEETQTASYNFCHAFGGGGGHGPLPPLDPQLGNITLSADLLC